MMRQAPPRVQAVAHDQGLGRSSGKAMTGSVDPLFRLAVAIDQARRALQ